MNCTPSFSWREAVLVSAHHITDSARSLTFAVPSWPGNEAGQHLDVRLTAPDGYQAVRSFSVVSVGRDELVEIAVARLPGGEVSPFLVDELEHGDRVGIRGPLGGFFVWRPEHTSPTQLIAGGSGVAPFVAMMRAHAAVRHQEPMRLLYSVRSPEDALYVDELFAYSPIAPTTFHYTRTAPAGWGTPRRLTEDDVRAATLPPSDAPLTYVCGPTGFVEAAARHLVAIGHPANLIRTERFGGI